MTGASITADQVEAFVFLPGRRKVAEMCNLVVKCRSRSGSVLELTVQDISVTGFMAERRALPAQPGDQMRVMLPGLAFQSASVVWVDDDAFGVSFEQPLYEPVLSHMLNTHRAESFAQG